MEMQDPKIAIWALSHKFVGLYLRNWGTYRQSKKLAKQQCLLHMMSQYGELRPTSGWDLLASLRHPCKFQRISRLGSVTARHSSSGRQPNFAALNRGRHLYSAGRRSRWALAHFSSCESNVWSLRYDSDNKVIMVALRNRADHNIFVLWFLLSSLWSPYGMGQTIMFSSCGFFLSIFFFFLAQSQRPHIGCLGLPYFDTWCGLSVNLECRSEMWCTRLAENTGPKK